MPLSHLLPTIQQSQAVAEVLDRLRTPGSRLTAADLPNSARPVVAAAALRGRSTPTLILTARADRALHLSMAIGEYLPAEMAPILWPAPEALPFEQLPFDLQGATRRVTVLDRLLQARTGAGPPPIVVASVHGITQLVMSPSELESATRRLRGGDRLSLGDLVDWAGAMGYEFTPLVQEPGSIARRGGIVDLFPPGASEPIRIDFFGDEIDTIRTFDPSSQRSAERLAETVLLPPSELPLWRLQEAAASLRQLPIDSLREEVATEWQRLLDRMEQGITPASVDLFAPYLLTGSMTLADYFQPADLLVVDEPSAIHLAATQLTAQAEELEAAFVANGELPAGLRRPIATWSSVDERLEDKTRLAFGVTEHDQTLLSLDSIVEAPNFVGRLSDAVSAVGDRLDQGWTVLVATDQVERLTELFEEQDIFPRREKRRGDQSDQPLALIPGTLEIRASDIDGGWALPDRKLLVLSDLEIFGFRKQPRGSTRRFPREAIAFATSLTPGEYVVHIDHGIARFTGLVRLENNGIEREYIQLEYARGDRLYVPVDQSDRVSRYSGGGVEPQVTRLGSGEWFKVKQRVRRAVREMAFELIQLYAARETAKGLSYGPDTAWDLELAESFPYTETPDQRRALQDVQSDMESPRPMDRLVCGDVGFGKTEVALRAAFKAVNAGRQVAVLVPTTVLALQHLTTFSQRLAAFPVRVEMLSRLRTRAEQREILAGLSDGSIDIVIGTHRLLQKDVTFQALGLAVVDEEQRFGVRHKEFFKRLRTEVDVLTMSATPIPRTLHMSLAGIRDISIIDTPPQDRLPIRTFVTEFQHHLVREVILREMDRGGQIFMVHNRVHDIDQLAHKLRLLVPEARFGIGHGQMDEEVLEEIILGFVRHDFDVLISTTIIESGVDIPNVNTILIDNADTMGLTQLYQLRGRVGRGTNRAYAYLLYRPNKPLSPIAQERLEAIQEATELGAGLRVAMRDMEIRGAGNILGAEQSGHIAAIGYELYIRLLAQAVEEARSGQPIVDGRPITLDLPITALIPADYIADTELRLATYRRIAAITSARELSATEAELEDRFGPIPEQVEHLIALIQLRLRCAEIGIESMIQREREIIIRPVVTDELAPLLRRRIGEALRLTPNSIRIRLPDLTMPWQHALSAVLDIVEARAVKRDHRETATVSR